MMIRSYSELSQLKTFEERYLYLQLSKSVGVDTFGFDRYLNQLFYKSREWSQLRDAIITRDLGCDLGIEGYEISAGRVLIHHMNPITKEDIQLRSDFLLDPDYLITTILSTHNAIHYGDKTKLQNRFTVDRTRNDTCPWKR